ncbi:APC family permease [Alicyclobacillus sendaiensis]|uniref:APC family permease n=1 Tax=Alicyclobacillus sendaiensis TaxID=192387 RepID=UPI00272C7F3D|nr:APC family permease [Alicyclobacillus sendaiensis]
MNGSEGGGFRRSLGLRQVLAIAVAAISPTTSVFLVYNTALFQAGTGVFWAFLIGACIALSMAFCYAELGSAYPGAGGAYRIVERVLGEPFGFIAVFLFLVLGVVITASILVSAASYLHSLVPALPVNWTAVAMMAIVTWLSLERIGATSAVATAMLALELAVILAFTGLAFAHAEHPLAYLGRLSFPIQVDHAPQTVTWQALLSAVVPALFAFNGYDWPLYFAEETVETRRVLPRAVLLAAIISVVVEVLAVMAATLAVPHAFFTAIPASYLPLVAIAQSAAGPVGATVLLVGVIIAMFDTGLTGNLAYARIYLDAARDARWPGPVNRFFASMNRRGVPKWGFVLLGVGNALLCYFTSLNDLITFTGVIIVTIYLLVAVSAVVHRLRRTSPQEPFRMPLWPLPPLIALCGVALSLVEQAPGDLVRTAVLVAIALVYALAYLERRRDLRSGRESSMMEDNN